MEYSSKPASKLKSKFIALSGAGIPAYNRQRLPTVISPKKKTGSIPPPAIFMELNLNLFAYLMAICLLTDFASSRLATQILNKPSL